MNSNKIKKIGYAIGYISGLIIMTCIVVLIVAFTVGVLRNIFGGM